MSLRQINFRDTAVPCPNYHSDATGIDIIGLKQTLTHTPHLVDQIIELEHLRREAKEIIVRLVKVRHRETAIAIPAMDNEDFQQTPLLPKLKGNQTL